MQTPNKIGNRVRKDSSAIPAAQTRLPVLGMVPVDRQSRGIRILKTKESHVYELLPKKIII